LAKALAESGLAIRHAHDVETIYGIGAGWDALRQMLSGAKAPSTAIFCGANRLTFGVTIVTQGVQHRAFESVADRFDDAAYAGFLSPALHTICIC
jgi:DNA-binding LacI/PurR family transcriptional regulator